MSNIFNKLRASTFFVCAALTLVSCGGSSGGKSPPAKSSNPTPSLETILASPLGTTQSDCNDLSLSIYQATPGERITLTGIPTSFNEANIRVISEKNTKATSALFIWPNETSDAFYFAAPFHPEGNIDGGDVLLELGDGIQYCKAISFSINPLPDADAHYADTIHKKIEALVDATLNAMGIDPEHLINADINTLDPLHQTLQLTKSIASGEGEASLKTIFSSAKQDNDKSLQRLLKASHIEEAIDNALRDMALLKNWQLEANPGPFIPRTQNIHRAQRNLNTIVPRSSNNACDTLAFDPKRLIITSPDELSQRMLETKKGYALDGTTSGATLGAASLLGHGQLGTAAGQAGAGVFVLATLAEARRAIEPQNIEKFEVGAVLSQWIEDRDPNRPLRWGTARVWAAGESFSLAGATLKGLIQAVGLVPGPIGIAASATSLASNGAIDRAIDDMTRNACFQIRAPEYGPILVNEAEWTTAIIESGDSFEISPTNHQEYRGIDQGNSTLLISLNYDKFATPNIWHHRTRLEVVPINIMVEDSIVYVNYPGESLFAGAKATNATSADPLNFTAQLHGEGALIGSGQKKELYYVDYQTPAQPEEYPTYIDFIWQGRTLPADAIRKNSTAFTIEQAVNILNQSSCMAPGATIELEATLTGLNPSNNPVAWSTTGGNISSTGATTAEYKAPSSTGIYRITATAQSHPSITDEIQVSVSDKCIQKMWYPYADISLDGNFSEQLDVQCGSTSSNRVQEFIIEPQMELDSFTQIPPTEMLWNVREEKISADLAHRSDWHQRIPEGGRNYHCASITLNGSNTSEVVYSADADGTLAFSMRANLHSEVGEFTKTNDTVEFHNNTSASINGLYYLNVTSAAKFRLKTQLSCKNIQRNGEDINHLLIMNVFINRFNKDNEPVLPSTPTDTRYAIMDSNGNPVGSLFGAICTKGDQTFTEDITFTIPASPVGEEHLVVISAVGNPIFAKQILDPSAGTYHHTYEVDFSMQLTTK